MLEKKCQRIAVRQRSECGTRVEPAILREGNEKKERISMTYTPILYLTHFLDTLETHDLKYCLDSDAAKTGLQKLASQSPQGLQLAFAINLMSEQGLRVGEVMGLEKTHLLIRKSASGNIASIKAKIFGKGHKLRVIKLSERNCQLFESYSRTDLYKIHDKRVFSVSDQVPIYYNFIKRRLKAIFGNDFKTHDFRRNYTRQASADGRNISAISNQLGHSSMNTTMIYDKRSIYRLEKDWNNPHPELIDSFPAGGRGEAGDFLDVAQLDEALELLPREKGKLVFCLIAFAGVKTSELAELRRADFKKTYGRLQIGARLIPIHDKVCERLASWCDERELNPSDLILDGIKPTATKTLFNRLSAKMNYPVNGKLLRASFIVAELNRGVDPISLANICGCTYENIARYIPCASDARMAALERRVTM